MKRKQLILACMLMVMAISASAQITTRHAADKVIDKVNLPPYDSIKNILVGKNVYSYIGQILYVNGIPDMGVSLQDHGYQNFYKVKEPAERLFKSYRYGKLSKNGGGTWLACAIRSAWATPRGDCFPNVADPTASGAEGRGATDV